MFAGRRKLDLVGVLAGHGLTPVSNEFTPDASPCGTLSGHARNHVALNCSERPDLRTAGVRERIMERKRFTQLVEQALDALPESFRSRMGNVVVLVEDLPPGQAVRTRTPRPRSLSPSRLVLGVFHGVPATKKSVFNLPTGPDTIVLYQKNIESVCPTDEQIREQVMLTVMHEIGHYFGMDEDQLRDV
jgi:predicted Zn-dependent protease with MMP-like domain